jgi:hypothetical protein
MSNHSEKHNKLEELHETLAAAREELLAKSTQAKLSEWIIEKQHTGFSEPSITNVFKKTCTSHRKINQLIKFINMYINEIENDKNKDKNLNDFSNPVQTINNKLEIFKDKTFYIYFYDEDVGNANIGRAVLSISKENNVSIKNIKEGAIFTTDYTGIVTLDKKQDYLILNMHTIYKEKDLHIRFRIPSDEKVAQYAIGGYMVTNNSSTLALGTLVLEYDENRKTNDMEAKTIEPNTGLYQELSENIRKFLKMRENNYIKMMTKVVFTDKEFELFFDAQKNKILRKKQVMDSASIYISYVTRKILDMDFLMLLEFLHKLKTTLTSVFKCEVYFEGIGEYKNRNDFKSPDIAIPMNMEKLNNADRFILIYSKQVASSALTELGLAIAQNKSIVIFHKLDKDLPWLIRNSAYIPNAHINRIIYKDNDDLIHKISKGIFK